MGRPRLHHHRAGRAERPPRADRALTGRTRPPAGADAGHHPRQLPDRPRRGSTSASGCSSMCRPKPGRSPSCKYQPPHQLDRRSSSGCASSRACSSFPAITSRWTATCASASARIPSISSAPSNAIAELIDPLAVMQRRSRAHRLRPCRHAVRELLEERARTARHRLTTSTAASSARPRAGTARSYDGEPCADAFEVIRTARRVRRRPAGRRRDHHARHREPASRRSRTCARRSPPAVTS